MLLDYCDCIEFTSLRSPSYSTFCTEILWSVNYIVNHQYKHPVISLAHTVCFMCFPAYDVTEARLLIVSQRAWLFSASCENSHFTCTYMFDLEGKSTGILGQNNFPRTPDMLICQMRQWAGLRSKTHFKWFDYAILFLIIWWNILSVMLQAEWGQKIIVALKILISILLNLSCCNLSNQ